MAVPPCKGSRFRFSRGKSLPSQPMTEGVLRMGMTWELVMIGKDGHAVILAVAMNPEALVHTLSVMIDRGVSGVEVDEQLVEDRGVQYRWGPPSKKVRRQPVEIPALEERNGKPVGAEEAVVRHRRREVSG